MQTKLKSGHSQQRIDNINKGTEAERAPRTQPRTTGERRGLKEDNQGPSRAVHTEPRPVVRNTTGRQPTSGRKEAEDGKPTNNGKAAEDQEIADWVRSQQ